MSQYFLSCLITAKHKSTNLPMEMNVIFSLLWFSCFISYTCSANHETTTEGNLETTVKVRNRRKLPRARDTLGRFTNATEMYNENDASENSEKENNAMQNTLLLQRLQDRLTAVLTMEEQILRKTETIEYRLTKLEVQMQEKSESVKSELREVSRRVQQLDWQSSKIDSVLESIKMDTSALNQGQEHLRGMFSETRSRAINAAETRSDNQLSIVRTSILSILGIVKNLQNVAVNTQRNFTTLINATKSLSSISTKLATKQDIHSATMEIRQDSFLSPLMREQFTPHMKLQAEEDEQLPEDCKALQQYGNNISGVYKIKPKLSTKGFFVYCDQETHNGGWTVIQNRYEGSVEFFRNWHDYKYGFGNLAGEFWLGLEKIHILSNDVIHELLIEMHDFTLTKTYALYSAFSVGTELEGYPISILGDYDGDAGDSLIYHAGMKFSTYDMDHDNWSDGNCAESHTGAWWYNGCDTSNLNGRYLGGEVQSTHEYQGMYWYDWHGPSYSLMKTRISIRPNPKAYIYVKNNGTQSQHKKPKNRKHGSQGEKLKITESNAANETESLDENSHHSTSKISDQESK
ncbi:angiopoietin-related protein 2-like [Schistocerca nitens]|uniref:angiopoietin-related protein 2-like n=1 Tax=Schistocerca nitens TaxID=7011 RepID=UPI0021185049|nr:angiopoietin-related protein 2-like [Schistocerca nitens]